VVLLEVILAVLLVEVLLVQVLEVLLEVIKDIMELGRYHLDFLCPLLLRKHLPRLVSNFLEKSLNNTI